MTTRDTEQTPPERAGENAEYSARIRRTNERLALSVAILFAVTGLLPITPEAHRSGVLWTAVVLVALTRVWFHLVPPAGLGDRRVAFFAVLLQPVVIVLLSLTGGNESPYFAYFLLPVLVTVYSPRTRHTLVIGAASAISLAVVALVARADDPPLIVAGRLTTDLIELLAFVLFTAFAGRALRDARRAITDRAEVLAAGLPNYTEGRLAGNQNFINQSTTLTVGPAEGAAVFIIGAQPGAPAIDLHFYLR